MPEPEILENGWVNTNPDRTKWIRIDPESGGLYRYNSENGQYDIALPIALSAITGLTDALAGKSPTFTGLTGTRTIDGHILTFTNGVLTGYQAP